MFPEIVRFGPIAVHSYGFMMMLAFFLGIMLAVKRGAKVGIPSGTIWDLSLWILFSSLIGARALYVLTHLPEFKGDWFSMVNPIQADGRIGIAGMDLLGGVTLAVAVSIWFIRRRKLNLWKLADVIAPPLALGIALGRIGCFANGCCYGGPTKSCLGVIFPPNSVAGSEFPGQPILPTQLFEFVWTAVLFAFLLFSDRWKKFDGFSFSLFLMGYGLWRIFIDLLREYLPSEYLIHTSAVYITVYQAFAFAMLVAGVVLYVKLKNAKPKTFKKGKTKV